MALTGGRTEQEPAPHAGLMGKLAGLWAELDVSANRKGGNNTLLIVVNAP
ncbi:hypothetical protein [Pseudooceanicola sp.]|nr:hypothetical protein [Pseudooceanicola sp.]